MKFILKPGELTYRDLKTLLDESTSIELSPHSLSKIDASVQIIDECLKNNEVVYGINTGFGALSHTRIETHQLETLQSSLILSHAAGTGEYLSNNAVRLILLLKINSLACGYSGVRRKTIETLIQLFNEHIYPCIPSKGSVGASGDLAPLAHLSAFLLGAGEACYQGKRISAKDALANMKLKPMTLAPKEGLALINGTQVSTALALLGLFSTETLFATALISGAMSVEATRGSHEPFDERIQLIKKHRSQMEVAEVLRNLLQHSAINASHAACEKVQDPYSLRCQPQVMGACLAQIRYCQTVLLDEANSVSDNPLIFIDQKEILSGGNFHAEAVALAADALACAIAEVGALSERRIALLTDPHFSSLPAFLVNQPGLNSGFMIPHVTAAALVSENKSLAHPSSVDSLPTSANQEDHVSMATYAAKRLLTMADNAITIVGIELLAACQGIDLLRPLTTSKELENIHQLVRKTIPFYKEDRFFAPDIEKIKNLIHTGHIQNQLVSHFF